MNNKQLNLNLNPTPTTEALSPDQRQLYINKTLRHMQKATKKNGPNHLQQEKNRRLMSHIKLSLDHEEDIDNDSNLVDAEYLAMDGILCILDSENYHAPNGVYDFLLQLSIRHKNYGFSYQLAHYLYTKRGFVSSRVVNILMFYANKQYQYDTAITLFKDNYPRLVDPGKPVSLSIESLHIEYLKALIAKKEFSLAMALCSKKLKDLYGLSYNSNKQQFCLAQDYGKPEKVSLYDACWTKPRLRSFCLILAELYHKNQEIGHAISIAECLRTINPHNNDVIVFLIGLYRKERDRNAILSLCDDYLQAHPLDIRIATHYLIFLLEDLKDSTQAMDFCTKFIENYAENHHDLRKIKILHAWFYPNYHEGTQMFVKLIEQFPDNPMIVCLAIRYAMKIGNNSWKMELIESAKSKFLADNKVLEVILSLSKANIICAAIENDYFTTASDLLEDEPKFMLSSRHCRLPPVVAQAFQRFCSCEIKPCKSDCLESVFLIGSAVTLCLDWNEAINKGEPFPIEEKLNDLDFVKCVRVIPKQNLFAGFEPSRYIHNAYSYNPSQANHLGDIKDSQPLNEPKIDLVLYEINPEIQNNPSDMASVIMLNRDFTINMLLLSSNGEVCDYTRGEGFDAYDNRYLKTFTDPHECLKADPGRVFRIAKKITQGYQLHPSLESALTQFEAPNWFENDRLLKKFKERLLHESGEEFVSFMLKYHLLGPGVDLAGIDFSILDTAHYEVLVRCLTVVINCFESKGQKIAVIQAAEQLDEQLDTKQIQITQLAGLQQQILEDENRLRELNSQLRALAEIAKKKKNKEKHKKAKSKKNSQWSRPSAIQVSDAKILEVNKSNESSNRLESLIQELDQQCLELKNIDFQTNKARKKLSKLDNAFKLFENIAFFGSLKSTGKIKSNSSPALKTDHVQKVSSIP